MGQFQKNFKLTFSFTRIRCGQAYEKIPKFEISAVDIFGLKQYNKIKLAQNTEKTEQKTVFEYLVI